MRGHLTSSERWASLVMCIWWQEAEDLQKELDMLDQLQVLAV